MIPVNVFEAIGQIKEKPMIILDEDHYYRFNEVIHERLNTNEYFKKWIIDVIRSVKEKNKKYICDQSLALYEKY